MPTTLVAAAAPWLTSLRSRVPLEKSLVRPLSKDRRPQAATAVSPPARRPRCLPPGRLRRADKDGVPAKVAHTSTTPTAPPASPCCTTPTAEKRHIIAPNRRRQGDRVEAGPVKLATPAAAQHPHWHCGPRCRASPGGGAKIARAPCLGAVGRQRAVRAAAHAPPARSVTSRPPAAPLSASR